MVTCLPAGRRGDLQMYYLYVLKSLKTGNYYKGITNNYERRLKEHFSGESKTTKKMLPFRLVYLEDCRNRTEARKLEKFFKSGYGREIIKEMADETIKQRGAVAKW